MPHFQIFLIMASLGGGTTWHSAALVITLREHPTLAALTAYGAELYKTLEEQGYGTGTLANRRNVGVRVEWELLLKLLTFVSVSVSQFLRRKKFLCPMHQQNLHFK